MKFDEMLRREGTPGPFVVDGMTITGNNDDGCVIAKMQLKIYDEDIEFEEALANARLLIHCFNKFPKLLSSASKVNSISKILNDKLHAGLEVGNEMSNLYQATADLTSVLLDAEEVEI